MFDSVLAWLSTVDNEILFMTAFLVLLLIAFVVMIARVRRECQRFKKWADDFDDRLYGFDDKHDGEQ